MRISFRHITLGLGMAWALAACGGGGGGESSSAPPAALPTASACCDRTVEVGTPVTLQGTGSTSSGGSLAYAWRLAGIPDGSAAVLADPAAATVTLVPDLPGAYVAELVVSDGQASSATQRVTITATTSEPTAVITVASRTQSVLAGETVTIDGSASLPPTGGNAGQLGYAWTLASRPTGSNAQLSGADQAKATFIADQVGSYEIALRVHYGDRSAGPVTAQVTAALTNRAPVANAGEAQNVVRGQTVTLDGSSSNDPDGDPLSYRWTLAGPVGSKAVLSDGKSVRPSFVADMVGTYTASLRVYDRNGSESRTAGTVKIDAARPANVANTPPVVGRMYNYTYSNETETGASSGFPRYVVAEAYDADGDALTYRWRLVSAPEGSARTLAPSTAWANMAVVTADVQGAFVVEVVANDGQADSAPMTYTLTSRIGANLYAPNNVTLQMDSETILVGSQGCFQSRAIADNDKDRILFNWSWLDRPDASEAVLSVSGEYSERVCFTADRAGAYAVQVAVRDDRGSDTLVIPSARIKAKLTNTPPVLSGFGVFWNNYHIDASTGVITAGTVERKALLPTLVLPGMRLPLFVDAVDADGDTLYFLFSPVVQPEGSTLTEQAGSGTEGTLGFTPALPGRYVWEAVVSDGVARSAAQRFAVDVQSPESYVGLRLQQETRTATATTLAEVTPVANTGFSYTTGAGQQSFETLRASGSAVDYIFSARGASYTITELKGEGSNAAAPAFFVGLTEGQVIPAGESVRFWPAFADIPASSTTTWASTAFLYSFKVKETGEVFYIRGGVTQFAGR